MNRSMLTKVLVLDAASCAAIFALGVGATAAVAGITGLPALVTEAGGWICLASAVLFGFLAVKPVRALLALGVAGNAAWIVASIAVWLTFAGQLTVPGHVFLLAQAAAVAVFVLLEKRGLAALGNALPAAA